MDAERLDVTASPCFDNVIELRTQQKLRMQGVVRNGIAFNVLINPG